MKREMDSTNGKVIEQRTKEKKKGYEEVGKIQVLFISPCWLGIP